MEPAYVDGAVYIWSESDGRNSYNHPVLKLPRDTAQYYKFAVLQTRKVGLSTSEQNPGVYCDPVCWKTSLVLPFMQIGEILRVFKRNGECNVAGKLKGGCACNIINPNSRVTDLENTLFDQTSMSD